VMWMSASGERTYMASPFRRTCPAGVGSGAPAACDGALRWRRQHSLQPGVQPPPLGPFARLFQQPLAHDQSFRLDPPGGEGAETADPLPGRVLATTSALPTVASLPSSKAPRHPGHTRRTAPRAGNGARRVRLQADRPPHTQSQPAAGLCRRSGPLVQPVEDLAPARVDDRHDEIELSLSPDTPPACATSAAKAASVLTPTTGTLSAKAERSSRRHGDPDPGEGTRPVPTTMAPRS